MENKHWINELMAYLYDEMTPGEKQHFEKILESDPELQKELESLKNVSKELAHVQDKEIVEPIILPEHPENTGWKTRQGTRNVLPLQTVIAIAASLLLILTIGYLTQFHIQYQSGNLTVGFNSNSAPDQAAGLSKEQIEKLVQRQIETKYGHLINHLAAIDSAVNVRLASVETGLESVAKRNHQTAGLITRAEMETSMRLTQNEQTKMFRDYVNTTALQQQKYFETTLTQFSEIMQKQRRSDLFMIQQNLVTMKEYQDQQKQETSLVLSKFFTSVYTQNE